MYWVFGDDCSFGYRGLHSLHLYENGISLRISFHSLICLEIAVHKISQVLVNFPDIILKIVLTLQVLNDSFSNKAKLVLVRSFQPTHGFSQATDVSVDGATCARPAFYIFLSLEFQQSSADIDHIMRPYFKGKIVKGMDFYSSLHER